MDEINNKSRSPSPVEEVKAGIKREWEDGESVEWYRRCTICCVSLKMYWFVWKILFFFYNIDLYPLFMSAILF
jgi:hypothetical protein